MKIYEFLFDPETISKNLVFDQASCYYYFRVIIENGNTRQTLEAYA